MSCARLEGRALGCHEPSCLFGIARPFGWLAPMALKLTRLLFGFCGLTVFLGKAAAEFQSAGLGLGCGSLPLLALACLTQIDDLAHLRLCAGSGFLAEGVERDDIAGCRFGRSLRVLGLLCLCRCVGGSQMVLGEWRGIGILGLAFARLQLRLGLAG
jgi:hypothetical protein